MSYVLDALKRSERDRHQGQVPNLASDSALMHLPKTQQSVWPYVLIAVLVLNACVFLFIYLSSDSESASGELTVATPAGQVAPIASSGPDIPPSSPTVSVVSTPDQPRQALVNSAAERPMSRGVENADMKRAQHDDIDTSQKVDWEQKKAESMRLIQASLQQEAEVLESRSEVAQFDESVPIRIDPNQAPTPYVDNTLENTLNDYGQQGYDVVAPKNGVARVFPEDTSDVELNAYQRSAQTDLESVVSQIDSTPFLYEMEGYERPRVPALRFNSHIYSDTPSARRVMINNIYLREGQSFNGIDLVEIGEQNILFEKDGTLFKLPAMRDWEG